MESQDPAFVPGQEVFGLAPGALGTTVFAVSHCLAPKPPNVTFAEAANVPTVFITVGPHNILAERRSLFIIVHWYIDIFNDTGVHYMH